jgi:NitT/TauT family transport system ATP-binding protein
MTREQPLQGAIEIQDVSVAVGAVRTEVAAVHHVDLSIAPGEFVSFLGPSGCGKTTLLNAIAGLCRPSHGRILVDRQPVTGPASDRGLVFQHHSLFPWRRVVDNVAFGLKMNGVAARQRREAARDFLELVGLSGFDDYYPAQLSGGMQQRVEIARVLINRPRVILMDEPFGALDAQTRLMMQELLLSIWSKFRTTIVFVTHDIDEAAFLSDRICVMTNRPGRIKDQIPVEAPRPRSVDDLASPEMAAVRRQCLHLIREESVRPSRKDVQAQL